MGKADRIAALEADIDRLDKRIATLTTDTKTLLDKVQALEAAADRPTLADTARREFHDKWNWLLDAVGV